MQKSADILRHQVKVIDEEIPQQKKLNFIFNFFNWTNILYIYMPLNIFS